ncbi:MAG: hypothetical protein K2M02_00345, partial [Duncaniella sp.]|nr:hypothetical protein [Duncaniella sp.]
TAITLVNRQEQEKFGRIEKFLGYEIKKNEVPAELGETPAYTPERKSDRRGGNRNHDRRGGNPRGRKDRPAPSRDKKKPQETTDAATTSPQPNRQQPKRRRNNRRNKNNNGSKNPSSRTEQ